MRRSRAPCVAVAGDFKQGWSLDLNTPDPVTGRTWDLSDPAQQRRALRMVAQDKPALLIQTLRAFRRAASFGLLGC